MKMTSEERLLGALRRQEVDPIPSIARKICALRSFLMILIIWHTHQIARNHNVKRFLVPSKIVSNHKGHRTLIVAGFASKQFSRHTPRFAVPATWTPITIGLPQVKQLLSAGAL